MNWTGPLNNLPAVTKGISKSEFTIICFFIFFPIPKILFTAKSAFNLKVKLTVLPFDNSLPNCLIHVNSNVSLKRLLLLEPITINCLLKRSYQSFFN